MGRTGLREALSSRILVGDGAMGTYLYQQGFPVGISYEELNLTRPDVIAEVHRRYVAAGAKVIETNTYSANREKLFKFGLEGETAAINREAVRIARQAAGQEAYVVGAIGSIRGGKRTHVQTSQIKRDFQEQIAALLEEGVDGLLFETFYDLDEMLQAVMLARQASGVPLICQFVSEDSGRTLDGIPLADAFGRLADEGADVVGLNCRLGPSGILRRLEQLQGEVRLPFSVFPNAGIPDYVDGKYEYTSTPGYFADSAPKFARLGARLIGGCCGTTPEHIAAIAHALSQLDPGDIGADAGGRQPAGAIELSAEEPSERPPSERDHVDRPPTLLDAVRKRHTVIVELDPPRDLDVGKFMAGCRKLQRAGADAVTMADNSLAVTRMSNMALGSLIKDRLGVRPLVHIACRDRNLIGTQSHLMGLDALGIDHVLAVTGDPARFGDLPGSSSVYDLTSFEIIRMIKQLNEGIAFSGKPLKQRARFVVGAAFNPHAKMFDKAIERLERKVKAGADYIMTQPVYDHDLIVKLREATKHLDVPIFIGIMPLASGRNAEYLHNEVPGILLSDDVRSRMAGLEGEEGRRMGVEIARELLDTAMAHFNGIYLITPFMLYGMTASLTEYVREKANSTLFRLSK